MNEERIEDKKFYIKIILRESFSLSLDLGYNFLFLKCGEQQESLILSMNFLGVFTTSNKY
jgi:hypothetical protein